MAASHKLVHTCTIQRAGVHQDAYGGIKYVSVAYLTDVPCRLVEQSDTAKLLVGPDTDIAEDDTVSNLVLEDGQADERTFSVQSVAVRRRQSGISHKTAELVEVEAPSGA